MKKLLCTMALVGAFLVPSVVEAQFTLGPAAAYHDDFDFGIGAYASFAVPQLTEGLSIVPSFMYFFPDGSLDYWELNGDVVYGFPVADDTPVLPFALGGLNIARASVSGSVGGVGFSSSSTDVGLNLGGGIVIPAESVRPVVGAKFEIQDNTGFVLFGGVGFPVGG